MTCRLLLVAEGHCKPSATVTQTSLDVCNKPPSEQEVVAATGYSRSWIYELVWGYNRIGLETLGDQRSSNQGSSKPLLDDVQQALLWQALQEALRMSRLLIGVLIALMR
jgi:hypothetical protein